MVQPLIDGSKSRFRAWFRKVWDVRGGGLYACGFAVTFVVLEVGSLADDVLGIGAIFNGEFVGFLVGFIIDSFTNTLSALIWPVYIVQWEPPWGVFALALAYWLFPAYVKEHIEAWLFDGDDEREEEKLV
jgi:hypothetical protein